MATAPEWEGGICPMRTEEDTERAEETAPPAEGLPVVLILAPLPDPSVRAALAGGAPPALIPGAAGPGPEGAAPTPAAEPPGTECIGGA